MIREVETRIVIRGGIVPPAGEGATVVLEGRRVAAVVPGRTVEGRPGDWDVDADGRLVVAGLVDAHAHLAVGAILRAAGLPGRPPPTMADLRVSVRDAVERRATPERVAPLVRAAAFAALRAGVTTAFDLAAGGAAAGDVLEATAGAVEAIGLRAVLALGARGPQAAAELAASAAFAARRAGHPSVRGMVGIAGLADLSDDALETAAAAGGRAGVHASVGEDESDLAHAFARWGKRPLDVLAARRLLGPRGIVAHAGTTSHAEGVALAEAGATLAVTPRASTYYGAPLAPIALLAASGVRVALGTGGLFPDVAGEALAAATLLRNAERTAAAAPTLLGRVAWPAAARLASEWFDAPLGRLEPGALADVVVLDWRPTVPLPALPDGDLALLWAGAPAAWVIVDGVVRIREGRLLGADEAELAAKAREAAGAVRG